jgi:hypothetical protein
MEEMNNFNSPELIEAVQLWTGWGQGVAPNRNDQRLVDRFGKDVTARLLPLIKFLEDDFYSSDARFVAPNLQEMEKLASEQFKRKHPGIAGEIVRAFAWCFTFDFK